MLRNVFIVLVLAALAATSAAASPVVPATARKFAHHKIIQHVPVRPGHRVAARAGSRALSSRAGRSTNSLHHRPAPRSTRTRTARRLPVTGRPTLRHASLVRNQGVRNPVVHNRVVAPSPLKGSLESLARQNERAEEDGL